MKQHKKLALDLILGIALIFSLAALPAQQGDSSAPPGRVVKLIFIHHSTGENLLSDDYGGLGLALGRNNYFVSDTNYGWGPDSIGDRTDIPDWVEWFASDSTSRHMDALFRESGQHSDYTRVVSDPGGENEIIVFKSCFPNSDLEGNPNDPSDPDGWLSVGHAKWVYNEILRYFGTRPDKLFVVITAPPLSDGTYARNARAFNNWLLNDWLRENNYTLANVAVFDFYNVLTGPDAHHRFVNGQIEHSSGLSNTLYYPSEDDHPSVEGSRKATEELVPLLNVYYHRWQAGDPGMAIPEPYAAPGDEDQPAGPVGSGEFGSIDDFESSSPAGSSGWEGYFQEGTSTRLICGPETGSAYGGATSLKVEFDVVADSWATCGFYFDGVQDWSRGEGVSFYLRADQAGLPFDVDLYGGSPGERTSYNYRTQTPPESVGDWVLVEVRWDEILRVEWEENPGTPFNPAAVTGFSFGLYTDESGQLAGTLWIDDLSLLGLPSPEPYDAPTEQSSSDETEPDAANPLCVGSLLLPMAISLLAFSRRRQSQIS